MAYKHPLNHVVYKLLRDDPYRKHQKETRVYFGVLKPSVAEKLRAALLLMGAEESTFGDAAIEIYGRTENERVEWLLHWTNNLKANLPPRNHKNIGNNQGWLCDAKACRSFVRMKLKEQNNV